MASVFTVDDEPAILELYEAALSVAGHEVVASAVNGEDAVHLYRRLDRRPDVVIMDQRMPLKSGLDATREILAMDPGARIVMVSADTSVREEALRAGALAFLAKPYAFADLLEVLRGALHGAPVLAGVSREGAAAAG